MKRILDAIENNLKNENYYGALYMALSLIGACANKENPSINGDGKKYIAWLEKYYLPLFEKDCSRPMLPSKAIYKLRCSVLHESSNIIDKDIDGKPLHKIILITRSSHRNDCIVSNGVMTVHEIQLNVGLFVGEIVESITKWIAIKPPEQTTLDFTIETGAWESATVGGATAFKDCS
jgi:hypothetical protein